MKYPDFEDAACRHLGVEFFFKEDSEGNPTSYDDGELKAVRRMCADCPINDTCLQWALHHERHGVWAGTVPHERVVLRRKLGILLVDPYISVTSGV